MAEPDLAAGSQMGGGASSEGRSKTVNFNADFNIANLTSVTAQLNAVTSAVKSLKLTLQELASSQSTLGTSIASMMGHIRSEAQSTAGAIHGLSAAVQGVSDQGYAGTRIRSHSKWGGSSAPPPAYSGGSGGFGGGGGGRGSAAAGGGDDDSAKSVGGAIGKGIAGGAQMLTNMAVNAVVPGLGEVVGPMITKALEPIGNLMMMPANFLRSRISANRVQALGMSQELTPYALSTGQSVKEIEQFLGRGPGQMRGSVSDFLQALSTGSQLGMYNNAPGGAGVGNFLSNIGFLQKFTPGIGAGKAASIVGSQYANVSSQQRGAFYTSGAFSMVKQGGGMKTIQEWAEGILRWLENQRPGADRGKPFTYGQMLAQNFPGSNINAWFSEMGISEDMRQYFWMYALRKAQSSGTTQGEINLPSMRSNLATQKAEAETINTQNEFKMSSEMAGLYSVREQANKWFNKIMGTVMTKGIPTVVKNGPLSVISTLPDPVEQFLWNILSNSGPLGQILGGGSLFTRMIAGGLAGGLTGGAPGKLVDLVTGANNTAAGDVGDSGFGMYGEQSTAGLAPDLRKKVEAMLQANPNLQVSSGLRDSYTQKKLKDKGIGTFKAGGMSQHAAGWAADIGPRSEYQWIQDNAHKFGLETGKKYGEPWHIQVAGTMAPAKYPGIGDIGGGSKFDVGGFGLPNPISGLTKFIKGIFEAVKMIAKVFEGVIKGFSVMAGLFSGGLFTNFSSVESVSQGFLGLLTGSQISTDSTIEGAGDVGDIGSMSTSRSSLLASQMLGSSTVPRLKPMPSAVMQAYSTSPLTTSTGGQNIHFHNQFNIPVTYTGNGSNLDLRRVSSQIADQLEYEMNKRLVRSK